MGGITMGNNRIRVYSYKAVKIEKGCFMIEYKPSMWSDTKILEKKFKSLTKAQEYALLNFDTIANKTNS